MIQWLKFKNQSALFKLQKYPKKNLKKINSKLSCPINNLELLSKMKEVIALNENYKIKIAYHEEDFFYLQLPHAT